MAKYLGLMSGTSCDGVDIALVDISEKVRLEHFHFFPYPTELQHQIRALYQPGHNEIDRAGQLHRALGLFYAGLVNQFIQHYQIATTEISAIGNHGQTIRHRPTGDYAFTLQLGCNHTLALQTGIRVVGDFRSKDIAVGGQGAPLVPAFHRVMYARANEDVFIVNIGGIANLTWLPASSDQEVIGFDTGPGNCLLDDWYAQHHNDRLYDDNGLWARQGQCQADLLNQWLTSGYFSQSGPRSTGREVFNLAWLAQNTALNNYSSEDIQATLAHLTAATISNAITALKSTGQVYLAGGGAHNSYVVELISKKLKNHKVNLINQLDSDPDSIEAMAFAWLAFAYDKKLLGNIPSVTGASKKVVLGCEFFPK